MRPLLIVTPGYRAGCTEPICRNLGRMILRHADAGSRPIAVLRNQHRAGVRHRCANRFSAAITLVYARAFVLNLAGLPAVQRPDPAQTL
jgi:hypothetical protein